MLKALWNQSWQSILKTGGKERRATGNHSEGLLCPAGDRGEATGDQSAFPALVRSRACSSSGPGAPSGQSSPSVNWLQLQRPERTCAALTSRALGWARLASTHLGVPFKGAGSFVRLWEGRPDSHLGWWPGLLLKRQWECRHPRAGQVGVREGYWPPTGGEPGRRHSPQVRRRQCLHQHKPGVRWGFTF